VGCVTYNIYILIDTSFTYKYKKLGDKMKNYGTDPQKNGFFKTISLEDNISFEEKMERIFFANKKDKSNFLIEMLIAQQAKGNKK